MSQRLSDFIAQRVSSPRLVAPAPDAQTLDRVFACALRAPDHKMLRPWRFLVVSEEGRESLGQLFLEAAEKRSGPLSDADRQKQLAKPLRAPMIIVGISTNQEHTKVPVLEQQISCGVGLGYMLLALQAEGFNGIWRTGTPAEDPHVKAGLGLQTHETIVGFLYVGSVAGATKPVPDLKSEDFISSWPA